MEVSLYTEFTLHPHSVSPMKHLLHTLSHSPACLHNIFLVAALVLINHNVTHHKKTGAV